MIEQIHLADLATFQGRHSILDLKLVNYFFGGNGVGKSTIANLIGRSESSTTGELVWKGGLPIKAMVYGKQFVESNFSNSDEFSGVFTLGADDIELANKTRKAFDACQETQQEIEAYQTSLELKTTDLASKDEALNESCWEVKKRNEAEFGVAFEGASSTKDRFKKKVFAERQNNKADAASIAELRSQATVLFGLQHPRTERINAIEYARLSTCEKSPILLKRVLGKEDVDIASMVSKLSSSDWVFRGRDYFNKNNDLCPFCQQTAGASLKTSLECYFDAAFVSDIEDIHKLEATYKEECQRISGELEKLALSTSRFLNKELLAKEKDLFNLTAKANLAKLEQKRLEPSRIFTLEAASLHQKAVDSLVLAANKDADIYNELLMDWAGKRVHLARRVWRHLLDNDLLPGLQAYDTAKSAFEKAIDGLRQGIEKKKVLLRNQTQELRTLQKQASGVQPTIDTVNQMLASFGFQGFRLAIGSSDTTYKIVRTDGSPAKDTLSDGEKTFITFLYFFYLLKGNHSAVDVLADRIVVFDDPVSSLDSNVLHVVSCLIKSLYSNMQDSKTSIRQIFVLTHNNYFHKEVSFFGNKMLPKGAVGFWHIRKKVGLSTITSSAKNPVKSHYEMLWSGLANKDYASHTLPNVLRRILESSSRLLGGMDVDEIYKVFEGEEREACRVLLSWINDGSHFALDDLFVSDDGQADEMYLTVFRKIFEKYGHISHYKMMMGEP